MNRRFILILSILAFVISKNWYMATNGSDKNSGDNIKKPLKTIMQAQKNASPGDIVYIRGGTYKNFEIAKKESMYNKVFDFTKSNITYRGYKKETVIFDFTGEEQYTENTKRVAAFFIESNAKNLVFEDFEVINVPALTLDQLIANKASKNLTQSECFNIKGKNITFNRIKAHDTNAIGFYFHDHSTGTAYRCDAYNNTGKDKASKGNCDGFGGHGEDVKFIECRAWDNSDDNFDCINSKGINTFESCWAFRLNLDVKKIQDGNGFKVGGYARDPNHPELHVNIVNNCIAANNKASGFYANHHPGKAATWTNNKSYKNSYEFNMLEVDDNQKDISGTREELHNNIGYSKSKNALWNAELDSDLDYDNSWNLGINIQDKDFQSLNITELAAKRKSDGSLPDIKFMKLKSSGPNYKKLKKIIKS